MKYLFNIILLMSSTVLLAQGPYADRAGLAGSSAMHKDSSAFIGWASQCLVQRGLQDTADASSGYATVGTASSAIGKAGLNGVVSLGDGGKAILQFDYPIYDGPGPDFAVFENSFSPTFLELAFVDVSSDGQNYFRFPAHSLTDTTQPIGGFGAVDPTNINNLAGKYVANYGTPFDLQEISNSPLLNKGQITHIRIVDVVGSLSENFATYDTAGRAIQDPYPTPFASSGFDLDAVGVIHSSITSIRENSLSTIKVYPNPVEDEINLLGVIQKVDFQLSNASGKIIKNGTTQNRIAVNELESGFYFLKIIENQQLRVIKIIKK